MDVNTTVKEIRLSFYISLNAFECHHEIIISAFEFSFFFRFVSFWHFALVVASNPKAMLLFT